jgi:phosphocarrier protein
MGIAESSVRIVNDLGLHARPSAEFVKLAGKYRCEISVAREGMAVNGKSILGVMTLAAEQGATLVIRAEGDDAEAAVTALEKLVARGFGE